MRLTVVLFVAFGCSITLASDPGQPLDCSDWVFLEQGHTCVTLSPFGLADNSSILRKGGTVAGDNAGGVYSLNETVAGGGSWHRDAGRLELLRWNGAMETVVAYIADRGGQCPGCSDLIRPTDSGCPQAADGCVNGAGVYLKEALTFDAIGGRMIFSVLSFCSNSNANNCGPGNDYTGWSIIAITGFPTLFDVLQSFTPPAGTLGIRVPNMPEGMAGADHLDTYYGSLTHPIDFTQAQPLACNYPSAPPHVGDYLTVADPLPDPTPGTGRYYVTATTYQGQTRYGRKTTAGHLSGRDPGLLPGCVLP